MTTPATGGPPLAAQQGYWDQRWGRSRSPNGYQLRRGEAVLRILRHLPLNSPRILDLGCGTGWFTAWLSEFGEATGIDLSERAIALAQMDFPDLEFMAGNFFELPLPREHFDVVVSQEVIAHVEDQAAYLDRITEVLKPGGHLILTTANKFVMERWDLGPDPPEHIKKWLSMKAVRRMLGPFFHILDTTTVIPLGGKGVLRLVNSYKVNTALGWLISRHHIESLKEKAGLGYTIIVLAQKK